MHGPGGHPGGPGGHRGGHRPPMGGGMHHQPPMGGGWGHRPPRRPMGCCGCLFPVIGVVVAVIAGILILL